MKCAWDYFIKLLPFWMRDRVDKLGKNGIQELRLRINSPPELVYQDKSEYLGRSVTSEDINFCINIATKYSPWASETVGQGFFTIPGGHRIGICGIVSPGNHQNAFATVTSLCIRVARDFPGVAKSAITDGSILIIGKPGSGKTTFLRDLIRQTSSKEGRRVVVVDERYEIFPFADGNYCFAPGTKVDILSGCNKNQAIEMVLRSMTPTTIAVDEITAKSDIDAILKCIGCGVSLLATAHAADLGELKVRSLYRSLLEASAFQSVIILNVDKTWRWEPIKI